MEPQTKTLEEWLGEKKELLILQSDHLHLPVKGLSQEDLALNLVNYYAIDAKL